MLQKTGNLEFVAALLHARRSQMAEGTRLRNLCQAQGLAEFTSEVLAEPIHKGTTPFQLKLITGLADEIHELAAHFSGPAAELLCWLAARFQFENVKVLVRRCLTQSPLEAALPHLITGHATLPAELESLTKANSIEALTKLLPVGPMRRALRRAAGAYNEQPRSFFLEGALDKAYLEESLRRADALSPEERALVRPMAMQEADIFHLMLVTRGKLVYRLAPEQLLPLHVSGTRMPQNLLAVMLAESELAAVTKRLLGRVVDAEPTEPANGAKTEVDPGILERLAWDRFRRLGNRAFRQSHMGLAAVVGYVQLRRIEVANLISASEGVRCGLRGEGLYHRLITPAVPSAAWTHV